VLDLSASLMPNFVNSEIVPCHWSEVQTSAVLEFVRRVWALQNFGAEKVG
jgi:hypothetical protein